MDLQDLYDKIDALMEGHTVVTFNTHIIDMARDEEESDDDNDDDDDNSSKSMFLFHSPLIFYFL